MTFNILEGMLLGPSVWSTKLLYDYLSPKTLALVCNTNRSIIKYAKHIDWNIKTQQTLDDETIIKCWEFININYFLDNYTPSRFVLLKKLGVKLTKYVKLIKHTTRYQLKIVDEQFAYEFPDFVDFDLLLRTKKLSEQFLLDFWYVFILEDVYKYQNISFELFRKTYLEELERYNSHYSLMFAFQKTYLCEAILKDSELLKVIDQNCVWHLLPDNLKEDNINALLTSEQKFKNRDILVKKISQHSCLSYPFLKQKFKELDFEHLAKNENLQKNNIFILKHNGSFYVMKLDMNDRINFMEPVRRVLPKN